MGRVRGDGRRIQLTSALTAVQEAAESEMCHDLQPLAYKGIARVQTMSESHEHRLQAPSDTSIRLGGLTLSLAESPGPQEAWP